MNTEEMTKQFNAVARKYDANRRKFIPCFDGFYIESTKFIADNIPYPKSILDLGAGTGFLSYFWYQRFPLSNYTLVDIAEDMLNIAQQRFNGASNVKCEICDYSQQLPSEDFDAIISALSIHHLSDGDKAALFKRIFDKLPSGGIFVNYDQFCAGSQVLNEWYDGSWEKSLKTSGLTADDLSAWRERRKLDRECTQEVEAEYLKACGFKEVKCIFCDRKFAVIVAIK